MSSGICSSLFLTWTSNHLPNSHFLHCNINKKFKNCKTENHYIQSKLYCESDRCFDQNIIIEIYISFKVLAKTATGLKSLPTELYISFKVLAKRAIGLKKFINRTLHIVESFGKNSHWLEKVDQWNFIYSWKFLSFHIKLKLGQRIFECFSGRFINFNAMIHPKLFARLLIAFDNHDFCKKDQVWTL